MNTNTEVLPTPLARIGMIIPAPNKICEQQFNALAPPTLGFHATRARIAGKWRRPIDDLAPHITEITGMLAECEPDLLVYNCTASSMQEGRAGERKILDIMSKATDIPVMSTSAVVAEAFAALDVKSVVVLSPYQHNNDIIAYLAEGGVTTLKSVALGLTPDRYGSVTPDEWFQAGVQHDMPQADGIFLSCAATTQIEAVDRLEQKLGKPVINSNQAVLWGCLRRLSSKIGDAAPTRPLGRLFQTAL
jgi:maleate cis-trans isomerase